MPIHSNICNQYRSRSIREKLYKLLSRILNRYFHSFKVFLWFLFLEMSHCKISGYYIKELYKKPA